jgi:hypothetical protein
VNHHPSRSWCKNLIPLIAAGAAMAIGGYLLSSESQPSDGAIHTFSIAILGGGQILANHVKAGVDGEPKCK